MLLLNCNLKINPIKTVENYPVCSWTDSTIFPDIVTSRHRRDWFFDISLQAVPEDDGVTVADFNRVVNMKTFTMGHGSDLRVVTSIAGKYDSNSRCLIHKNSATISGLLISNTIGLWEGTRKKPYFRL